MILQQFNGMMDPIETSQLSDENEIFCRLIYRRRLGIYRSRLNIGSESM